MILGVTGCLNLGVRWRPAGWAAGIFGEGVGAGFSHGGDFIIRVGLGNSERSSWSALDTGLPCGSSHRAVALGTEGSCVLGKSAV